MPTYQYACTVCGHQLEAVQSFTDAPLVQCPECEGRLRKVFSGIGVVFKGSGFYRTDSRAAESASDTKSDSKPSESKPAEKKSPDTTPSTPATKGETASTTKTPAAAPAAA